MNSTHERNKKVKEILDSLYSKAIDTTTHLDETPYKNSIDTLFSTTAWGFREILLVVIVGMSLDVTYRPSTALYDCNPRAIYEGPIKEFLIDKEIPHRKSGPLNVAKATPGLDSIWAAQRRPSNVATEVVNIIKYIEEDPAQLLARASSVGISLFRRLLAQAREIRELSVEIQPNANPEFLYWLCHELIAKAPDAGNTPQRIAAYLLKNYHLSLQTGIIVTGEDDRASVTSTTSKKPGDINEETSLGQILKVYEITVKPFDLARIRDSYDCLTIYNSNNGTNLNEVIVICRAGNCPSDMNQSNLHSFLGSYSYQNIVYYFIDIFEWIAMLLQHTAAVGRQNFYSDLNNYIDDINTSEAVKALWRTLHNQ